MRQLSPTRKESLWDFMNEVERAFDEAWRTPATRGSNERGEGFIPAVDLHETDDLYLVSMDLPGVAEKDVKIDVQNGRLAVSGERRRETRSNENGFKRYERSYGRFERLFALPQDVNQDGIKARFENGVLEIMIPKAEVAKPRSIAIEKDSGGLFSRLLGQKSVESKKSDSDQH
ncbi:MAG: Hsp20/alpha crystallin family protein [Calothrix sp. SM1_5_4]|nr:Hsp20/alpha crystallin family protein [Calothrix sp. SM1_5_4]